MKYALFIAICAFTYPVAAQEEQWDTYMAKFGDKPGSVLVDMGLHAIAPDKRYPNLVITGPRGHNCNAQGLPAKDEIDLLEGILDATGNFLTGVTPKVLAGTFTCNCERLNYYYVKDTSNIRYAISRMYSHSYRDYEYVLTIKYDPQWSTYQTFLYPDEATKNWMENDKIISGLLQSGDHLTNPHIITFELVFRTDTDRKSFTGYALKKGYTDPRNTDPGTTSNPYMLHIAAHSTVKTDTVNVMTADLKREARLHHGMLNGWQAKQQ